MATLGVVAKEEGGGGCSRPSDVSERGAGASTSHSQISQHPSGGLKREGGQLLYLTDDQLSREIRIRLPTDEIALREMTSSTRGRELNSLLAEQTRRHSAKQSRLSVEPGSSNSGAYAGIEAEAKWPPVKLKTVAHVKKVNRSTNKEINK